MKSEKERGTCSGDTLLCINTIHLLASGSFCWPPPSKLLLDIGWSISQSASINTAEVFNRLLYKIRRNSFKHSRQLRYPTFSTLTCCFKKLSSSWCNSSLLLSCKQPLHSSNPFIAQMPLQVIRRISLEFWCLFCLASKLCPLPPQWQAPHRKKPGFLHSSHIKTDPCKTKRRFLKT